MSFSNNLTSFIMSFSIWYSWIVANSSASNCIFSLINEKMLIYSSSFKNPSLSLSKTSKKSWTVVIFSNSYISSLFFSNTNSILVSFKDPSFQKSAFQMACHICLHFFAHPIIGLASPMIFWIHPLGIFASVLYVTFWVSFPLDIRFLS